MDYQTIKMLEMCDRLQRDIIANKLADIIKPMLNQHHVTKNHKVKWHYHLALYIAHHIIEQWRPPK